MELTQEEVRVLGSFIEKENTTPEYYPLTINSLTNACNQKSNREPVVNFAEAQVKKIVEDLIEKNLIGRVTSSEFRVTKFRQLITTHLKLTKAETAVICVLMLRGAQTPGEIKGRSARIYEFNDLAEVEEVLTSLIKREDPLAVQLPRTKGREYRYMHLLCGEPDLPLISNVEQTQTTIESLSIELAQLREDFEKLKNEFESFKELLS